MKLTFRKPPNFYPLPFIVKNDFASAESLWKHLIYIYIYPPKKLCRAGFLLPNWRFKKGRISRLFTTDSDRGKWNIQIVVRVDLRPHPGIPIPFPTIFEPRSSRDKRRFKEKGGKMIIFSAKVAIPRGYRRRESLSANRGSFKGWEK